jgi:hypothetical protein
MSVIKPTLYNNNAPKDPTLLGPFTWFTNAIGLTSPQTSKKSFTVTAANTFGFGGSIFVKRAFTGCTTGIVGQQCPGQTVCHSNNCYDCTSKTMSCNNGRNVAWFARNRKPSRSYCQGDGRLQQSEAHKSWFKACCEWQPYNKPHADEGQCCGQWGNLGTDQLTTNKNWCNNVKLRGRTYATKILTKKQKSSMMRGIRSLTKKAGLKFVSAIGKGGHQFAEAAGGGDAEESD